MVLVLSKVFASLKMKTVLIFVCVLGVTFGDRLEVEEQVLESVHEDCQANPSTFVDPQLLQNLSENINDPRLGAHFYCESRAVGLQKANGDLNLPVITSKISLTIKNTEVINKLLRKCAVRQQSPKKTATHLFMCLHYYGVTYFHEF
nr:odorant binding protein 26 [Monochamus saltuarius]